VAEGLHMADEALRSAKQSILKIYATASWIAQKNELPQHEIVEVSEDDMRRLSHMVTPTPVLILMRLPVATLSHPPASDWSLWLDGVQDPGNVGTIIRIADWFGISHMVLGTGTADAFAPKTVQATMGSLFRVNIVQGEISKLLTNQYDTIYGATLSGKSIWNMHELPRGPIVIGSEGGGISPEVMPLLTQPVTIPRIGHAESLNAAVATGIICSHCCKA